MSNFIENTIGNPDAISSNELPTIKEEDTNIPKSSNRSKPMAVSLKEEVGGDAEVKEEEVMDMSSEVEKEKVESVTKKKLTKEEKKAKRAADKLKKKEEREAKENDNN